MEKQIRYTLGSKERVKSRKVIERLFKEGRSFSIFPFRVLYILSPSPLSPGDASKPSSNLQAGFTVSSRHFKKAVERNRVKRLMRESYRLQKNGLQLLPELNNKTLSLFFIYVGKELPDYKFIYEKMAGVLQRLTRLTAEKK